jgi:recombination protein RecT
MTELTASNSHVLVSQCLPRFQEVSRTNGELVKWDTEKQFAIQALQKNSKLRECAVSTIENAIINIAACGLTLNPSDGYAYLIPEWSTQTKQNECVLRISFKGLIKSATDSGVIKWVRAGVVKENDEFNYKGPCEMPSHNMDPFSERGKPVGVYCIAKTADGDVLADTMPWAEVIKIQNAAKTQVVWNQWPEEMAKKAIIKRASKQWPKSDGNAALHATVATLNAHEGSDPLENLADIANDIIIAIENNDIYGFGELWPELTEDQQAALWVAETKGGFFSQAQKKQIREWQMEWPKIQNKTIEGEVSK